ncbi:MAG TPA: hypothetical protein QGF58_11195 [Myxococcota bacterium]|nr:hypothetical protein [Myxococcota bacterium]
MHLLASVALATPLITFIEAPGLGTSEQAEATHLLSQAHEACPGDTSRTVTFGAEDGELSGLSVETCPGDTSRTVTFDAEDGELSGLSVKPTEPCFEQALRSLDASSVPSGHYVVELLEMESALLLSIIGTTGDEPGVEDIFSDPVDMAALDAAFAASTGVVVAASPSVTPVSAPPGLSFPPTPAQKCDGKEGSNTSHRAELLFQNGHAMVMSISPEDDFSKCLETELTTLRADTMDGSVVVDVIGTH